MPDKPNHDMTIRKASFGDIDQQLIMKPVPFPTRKLPKLPKSDLAALNDYKKFRKARATFFINSKQWDGLSAKTKRALAMAHDALPKNRALKSDSDLLNNVIGVFDEILTNGRIGAGTLSAWFDSEQGFIKQCLNELKYLEKS